MINFLKKWTLLIALISGFLLYHIGTYIPNIDTISPAIKSTIAFVQPGLIISMLFLTYLKINIKNLRLSKWQFIILFLQIGISFLLALLIPHVNPKMQIWFEAAILCFICPTATAAAVVTEKLKGNVGGTVLYTMLINIASATTIPILLPLFRNISMQSFSSLAGSILEHTFPVLITPLIGALLFRYIFPETTKRINSIKNLAFYLWAIALSIAMGITAKNIAQTTLNASTLTGIGIVSLICCIFQFSVGKFVGRKLGDPISSGQSFGQKNIVFAIWLSNSFFNPATAIAGGCYSIWHNLFNSWQIHRANKIKAQ